MQSYKYTIHIDRTPGDGVGLHDGFQQGAALAELVREVEVLTPGPLGAGSEMKISAVMDRPALVGVGIDEATAVVVQGKSLEVIGKSSVVILDARDAKVEKTAKGGLHSGRDLKLTVLRAGQKYSLK